MLKSDKYGVTEDRGSVQPQTGKSVRRGVRGVTLIEVLIALFILSVGILPVATLSIDCSRTMMQAHVRTAAYAAARQELEDLRNTSFDSRATVSGGPVSGTFTIPASVLAEFPQAAIVGSYVTSPLSTTLQQVMVQVSWNNPAAGYNQVSRLRLDTLIAKEPGQ